MLRQTPETGFSLARIIKENIFLLTFDEFAVYPSAQH
jgi:hypothetical protein